MSVFQTPLTLKGVSCDKMLQDFARSMLEKEVHDWPSFSNHEMSSMLILVDDGTKKRKWTKIPKKLEPLYAI